MIDRIERELLPSVRKPARYIGDEINAVRKPPSQITHRIALAFPDTYEIGMSHLGLPILYHIINGIDGIQAERVFAPWIDAERIMREKKIPLFSLETFRPVSDFDLIGFSLQYELSYTNVLNMLELSGLPVLASERGDQHPPVIAGGPCAFNPEPLVDFIDAFVIGDGEEEIVRIVHALRESNGKSDFLARIAGHRGVYVPALHDPERVTIRKAIVWDIRQAPHPTRMIVPHMEIVHDCLPVEVMRGCVNNCRFCQAGIIYRPERERDLDEICDLISEGIAATGFSDVSLLSLSTCDYSRIGELISRAMSITERRNVALSLPSSRIDSFSIDLARTVQRVRKTGLTFAPETGTERLRNVINKPISDEEILQIMEQVFAAGWSVIKLYFMVGLPTETDEDVERIAHLSNRIIRLGRRINRRASLNVSVSGFVPKPHTPFQWERQLQPEEMDRRIKLARKYIRSKNISFKWSDPMVTMLEGVFARGDRRLGQVLLEAHRRGCRFDGWTERFDFTPWQDAFDSAGMSPLEYLRARELDERLPWDHIDPLVSREYLISEREKAYSGRVTPACRLTGCANCGVMSDAGDACLRMLERAKTPSLHESLPVRSQNPMPVQKVRIRFSKTGRMRYLSHRDIAGVIIKAMQRASIPVAFSRGFSPRPRLSLAHSSESGVSSFAEIADISLEERISPPELKNKINNELPDGIKIEEAVELPQNYPAPMKQSWCVVYAVEIPDAVIPVDDCCRRVADIISSDELLVEGKRGRMKNIRPLIKRIECVRAENSTALKVELIETASGRARLEDVIHEITGRKLPLGFLEITKTESRLLEDRE